MRHTRRPAHEFNHGYSAPQKNVLDYYFAEFEHKPVAFVGYGNVGGSRAIEQLRQVIVELNMDSVREGVHILGPHFPAIRAGGDAAAEVLTTLEPRLTTMTDHLLWWAHALTVARTNSAQQFRQRRKACRCHPRLSPPIGASPSPSQPMSGRPAATAVMFSVVSRLRVAPPLPQHGCAPTSPAASWLYLR